MNLEILRLLRNIFLRSCAVGVGIGFISWIITLVWWNCWVGLATSICHTDEATLTQLTLRFFADMKFYLIFLLLTPGLAMHWTLKREEARKS
jgi:hypothetical protein